MTPLAAARKKVEGWQQSSEILPEPGQDVEMAFEDDINFGWPWQTVYHRNDSGPFVWRPRRTTGAVRVLLKDAEADGEGWDGWGCFDEKGWYYASLRQEEMMFHKGEKDTVARIRVTLAGPAPKKEP